MLNIEKFRDKNSKVYSLYFEMENFFQQILDMAYLKWKSSELESDANYVYIYPEDCWVKIHSKIKYAFKEIRIYISNEDIKISFTLIDDCSFEIRSALTKVLLISGFEIMSEDFYAIKL